MLQCIIFYHDASKGYGRLNWEGDLEGAREWFESFHDCSRMTYCGVALADAVIQS